MIHMSGSSVLRNGALLNRPAGEWCVSSPIIPGSIALVTLACAGMPRMVPMSEREAARFLMARLRGLQPGQKRISIHATRRSGKDRRLLLCEYFLYAVYPIWESDAPWNKNRWERTTASSPDQYHGGFKFRSKHHLCSESRRGGC